MKYFVYKAVQTHVVGKGLFLQASLTLVAWPQILVEFIDRVYTVQNQI